ncbi:class I SAM-dependent methyltransferase [Amycolatopsis anabasis]|uniref:class I SAM-dependent methyltransferase n=1 Tax=Amycolatopsis anabasis TaxID=1840409 RepID=UPI00131C5EAB|nr:class I SAM-dependent methyltransferase [Amycolatopsis anabasis]
MATGKVHFTEEQSTNLATLYGRALDNRLPRPILGDPTAEETVRKIDYDFGKFKMKPDMALSVAMRAKVIDERVRAFLREHPDATVLHLGCGMDSRVYRIDPPRTLRWYDVDYPDVIDLRKQVYPEREGYQQIGSSVTELDWLERVPADGPALVVAEGLTMYLDPEGGRALLRALAARFPSGEMVFDVFGSLGIKLQKLNPVVRRAKATLSWGIDDAHELERLGLTLVEELDASYFAAEETVSLMSPAMRLQLKLALMIPLFRNMGRILRYRF